MAKKPTSWSIIKLSWRILQSRSDFLWLSIMCIVITAGAAFIITETLLRNISYFTDIFTNISSNWITYVLLSILGHFVIFFFNAIIIISVHISLHQGDTRIADGLRIVMKNVSKIFLWSVISATFGLIMKIIKKKNSLIQNSFASIFTLSWRLLTYFTLPIMIIEKQSVFASIKSSGQLLKKT